MKFLVPLALSLFATLIALGVARLIARFNARIALKELPRAA